MSDELNETAVELNTQETDAPIADAEEIAEDEIKEEVTEPLELVFSTVRDLGSDKITAYRSVLKINRPNESLMPRDYKEASEKSDRGEKLMRVSLSRAAEVIEELTARGGKFDWLSVYCPAKSFVSVDLAAYLEKYFDKQTVKRLCIELSPESLNENSRLVNGRIDALNKLGCKTMLSGFGNEYCPVIRLQYFDFDMVILDPEICGTDMPNDITAKSLVSLIRNLKHRVAADGIMSDDKKEKADALGCDLYCNGSLMTYDELIDDLEVKKQSD